MHVPTDAQLRCLACRYRLDGLDVPRCPECGRRFDLRVPTSYASPHGVSCRPCMVWGLVVAVFGVAPILLVRFARTEDSLLVETIIANFFAVCAYFRLTWVAGARLGRTPRSRWTRRGVETAVVASSGVVWISVSLLLDWALSGLVVS